MKDEDFLRHIGLTAREWRAIEQLARSDTRFEPLTLLDHVGPLVIDRLLQMEVAERGPASARAEAASLVGYRLTARGWKVLKRGRAADRSA
jgi:hypothetical protein